jgi:glutathione synthase/RimK-type ligase-like ATP-grasp enzyme
MRLALVTAKHVEPHATDDRLLCEALTARGHGFDWFAWDDEAARWQDYDRVVLRSCWDYHLYTVRFQRWLQGLGMAGVNLVNPLPLVLENLHKRYLLRLADAGIPVPPLKLVPHGSQVVLADLQAELGDGDLIVKPAVSGSAWRTLRVPPDDAAAAQPEFAALAQERDVIVQAFVPEIGSLGEYSLMFFGGRYSHAVLKTPRDGEFRCQSQYGGSVTAPAPPAEVLETAQRARAVFGGPPYARLDLVVSRGLPMVMEVELIEPVLFFAEAPQSAALMVDTLSA